MGVVKHLILNSLNLKVSAMLRASKTSPLFRSFFVWRVKESFEHEKGNDSVFFRLGEHEICHGNVTAASKVGTVQLPDVHLPK